MYKRQIGYKYTGTASQAALQIVNTFTQLAMILSQGIGTAAGIMLGKLLGENKLELVKAYSRRFMVLIPAVAFVLGVIIALFSPLLLSMFNVGEESLGYAQKMLSLIHISEPTRLGMISYAVFCLKKKKQQKKNTKNPVIE